MDNSDSAVEVDEELERFWVDARVRAGLNPIRGYAGPNALDSVMPPAWSFGSNAAQADRLLDLVLAGAKTATASAASEYAEQGVELPQPGGLSIILDGAGKPRVLVRTVDVRVVPFNEVDAEHAAAEGEDGGTLWGWQQAHRRFFASQLTDVGEEFDETMPVVLERFEVLVPTELQPGSPRLFGR